MRFRYFSMMLLAFGLLFAGCKRQEVTDKELILEYLAANNLTAESTDEGVYYIIEQEGNGEHPTINDQVTVHYEGFLLDGTKFDSSIDRGEPTTFPLSGVIEGWQIGIPKFSKGGSGKLFVPSKLAYGSSPPSGIPADAVMIFTVQLIDF